MPRSYRLPAIAIVGLALLAAFIWWLVERQNERESAYRASYQQYQETKRDLPPGVAIENQRSVPDPKSYREEWRSEHDLDAQRDMADWTFFMLVASSAGVLVTAIGVIYVALTLRETRAAVREAEAATKAAEAAVDVTRDVGIAQIRAYVAITKFVFRVSPNNKPCFEIMFANAGQSPTRNIEIRIIFSVTETLANPRIYESRELIHTMPDLVPGQERERKITGFPLPENHPVLIGKGPKHLLVLTIAKYVDVFGGEREDPFRHTAAYAPQANFKERRILTPEPRWMRNPQQPET